MLASVVLLLWIGGVALQIARQPFVSQDDTVQHVVWFRRYMPSGPLADSRIGDFFIASTGPLYRALYEAAAWSGIDPITVARRDLLGSEDGGGA